MPVGSRQARRKRRALAALAAPLGVTIAVDRGRPPRPVPPLVVLWSDVKRMSASPSTSPGRERRRWSKRSRVVGVPGGRSPAGRRHDRLGVGDDDGPEGRLRGPACAGFAGVARVDGPALKKPTTRATRSTSWSPRPRSGADQVGCLAWFTTARLFKMNAEFAKHAENPSEIYARRSLRPQRSSWGQYRFCGYALRTTRCRASAEMESRRGCWPSRRIDDRPLEPEPESGVRHRAVAAQVPVPRVMLRVEIQLGQPAIESSPSRSSRCEPPMISPMPGARTSIAATVFPSSFMRM